MNRDLGVIKWKQPKEISRKVRAEVLAILKNRKHTLISFGMLVFQFLLVWGVNEAKDQKPGFPFLIAGAVCLTLIICYLSPLLLTFADRVIKLTGKGFRIDNAHAPWKRVSHYSISEGEEYPRLTFHLTNGLNFGIHADSPERIDEVRSFLAMLCVEEVSPARSILDPARKPE